MTKIKISLMKGALSYKSIPWCTCIKSAKNFILENKKGYKQK